MFERTPTIIQKLYPQIIWKNNNSAILYTFDDGPDKHYSLKFAELCAFYHQKAIFFILGERFDKQLCQDIIETGATIAWHGQNHFSFIYLSKKEIHFQLESRKKVEDLLGISIDYFRFPYGRFLPHQLSYVASNLKVMMWSFQCYDYKLQNKNKILMKLQKIQNYDIVLLHDASKNAAISFFALKHHFKSWKN